MPDRDRIERLKAATDARQVADRLGLQSEGTRFFCPACQPTGGKSPDLSVKGGGFLCYKCGKKGDVLALIQLATGLDFMGVVKWLEEETGLVSAAGPGRRRAAVKKPEIPPSTIPGGGEIGPPGAAWIEIYRAFLDGCRELDGKPLSWLTTERRIDADIVAALGLRFCGQEYRDVMADMVARFGEAALLAAGLLKVSRKTGKPVPSFWPYYRAEVGFLVIPYYQDGAPVYLKARPTISAQLAEGLKVPRFMNTAARVPCLYNVDVLKKNPPRVYVCEGESDTWAALTFGEAAVGSPGARNFKREWIELFRPFRKPDGTSAVCLIPDRDKAGAEGARMVADLFVRAGLPVPLEKKIPDGFKDLGDYLRG